MGACEAGLPVELIIQLKSFVTAEKEKENGKIHRAKMQKVSARGCQTVSERYPLPHG